jgi:hypothetical protein
MPGWISEFVATLFSGNAKLSINVDGTRMNKRWSRWECRRKTRLNSRGTQSVLPRRMLPALSRELG